MNEKKSHEQLHSHHLQGLYGKRNLKLH